MQSVTCLTTNACLTADPGVASLIPTQSHTFVKIYHEIISMVILLPSADSFKKGVVCYKPKYVHEVLVNHLFKLAPCPGKSVVRWTDCPDMTIAVYWDVKQQNKQTNNFLTSEPKHMLWVLKQSSQWDGSFEHQKHMLKLMGKKIFTILC